VVVLKGYVIYADLFGCQTLIDKSLESFNTIIEAVTTAGMRPVHSVSELFPKARFASNSGVSVMTLIIPLTESHCCLHTCPEFDNLTCIDLFTCGPPEKAHKAVELLIEKLKPKETRVVAFERGLPVGGDK
jgi:S-adenosylmethionine/arginine decarboxylase-like enzyme